MGWFTKYSRVISVVATYEVKTDSGYVLASKDREMLPKDAEVFLEGCSDGWDNYRLQQGYAQRFSYLNSVKLHRRAGELLREMQKKGFEDTRGSVFERGKHIVACDFELSVKLRDATREERMKLRAGELNVTSVEPEDY